MSEVAEIIKQQSEKFGKKREALMPMLQAIVEKQNYLKDEDMIAVAKELDISAADVYGTASFYSFLSTKELGKYVIRICQTITCDMKGKQAIIDAIAETLRINVGETTADKKFSLLTTNCIGWCHKAPAMLINDEPYTELTPQKAIEIIEEYMSK